MEEVEMLERMIKVLESRGDYFDEDPLVAHFQRMSIYNMDPYILADMVYGE